jgi:hypothetical protein
MQRRIVGFEQDANGDWIALLDCGHRRHVRHRPPFLERPWTLSERGRAAQLGRSIECGLCARDARSANP